jgi:hypothetical protein
MHFSCLQVFPQLNKLILYKWEILTGARAFQKSMSVLGASAMRVAHEISMMRDPAARERVEVNHGKGNAFKTFLLYMLNTTFKAHHVAK